jgi:hypothetical protein
MKTCYYPFSSILAICLISSFYKFATDSFSILDSTLHFHKDIRFAPVVSTNSTTIAIKTPLKKIVHVVNLYSVPSNTNDANDDDDDDSYAPLDQKQSVTIASMIRARQMALTHMDIRLVSAVFPEDAHVVPDDFEIRYLNRSTLSEYSNANSSNNSSNNNKRPLTKKLPFLQDLIKGVETDEDDFDYFIYTNSDIGLDQSFYNHVAEIIGRGYDAFSINRRTLPKKYYQSALEQSTFLDLKHLEQLYSILPMGYHHPGRDCFVISRAVWQKVYLGRLFVGYPPWGVALETILQQVASNYYNFKSHENVTFHLGNDQAWRNDKKDQFKLTERQYRRIRSCPIHLSNASPYFWKNMKNCAALFQGGQNHSYKYKYA